MLGVAKRQLAPADAATILGDLEVRQLVRDSPEPFQGPALVFAHHPRKAGQFGGEDRGKTADGGHGRPIARFFAPRSTQTALASLPFAVSAGRRRAFHRLENFEALEFGMAEIEWL